MFRKVIGQSTGKTFSLGFNHNLDSDDESDVDSKTDDVAGAAGDTEQTTPGAAAADLQKGGTANEGSSGTAESRAGNAFIPPSDDRDTIKPAASSLRPNPQ